jgi:hypothetical protein
MFSTLRTPKPIPLSLQIETQIAQEMQEFAVYKIPLSRLGCWR